MNEAMSFKRHVMSRACKLFGDIVALGILGSLLSVGALACGDRPGLITRPIAPAAAAANLQTLSQPEASSVDLEDSLGAESSYRNTGIVGMWIAEFLVGNTTQTYDRAIMIFYADGNETENDIAVPPATENVCYGVWERTGHGTFKVRHLGWVFDVNGMFAGTVEVTMTMSLVDTAQRSEVGMSLNSTILRGTLFRLIMLKAISRPHATPSVTV